MGRRRSSAASPGAKRSHDGGSAAPSKKKAAGQKTLGVAWGASSKSASSARYSSPFSDFSRSPQTPSWLLLHLRRPNLDIFLAAILLTPTLVLDSVAVTWKSRIGSSGISSTPALPLRLRRRRHLHLLFSGASPSLLMDSRSPQTRFRYFVCLMFFFPGQSIVYVNELDR